MIAVIDYGVGNIFSLVSAFSRLGAEVVLTGDPDEIRKADKLVLPGVGAFGDAAQILRETGLAALLKEEAAAGKPLLGICLGMQLLFEKSFEYGEHPGLGLVPGEVVPMEPVLPKGYKIPHIGWNALHFPEGRPKSELFRSIREGDFVYFVHSYYASKCGDSVIATAEYGAELTAAVQNGCVFGCQFHPEKSGKVGQEILRAFCTLPVS